MNRYIPVRVGKKEYSILLDRKALQRISIAALVLLVVTLLSLGSGEIFINPWQIVLALGGQGDTLHQLVVMDFRLPRILISLLVGIGLAVSGALLQGIVRNPLASPDIIGLTGGASVFVVGFLTLLSDSNGSLTVSIHWLPLAAFLGALSALVLVYWFSWNGGISPTKLVLIGIGMSLFLHATTTLLMLMGPIYRASQANIWITGSVNGSNWSQVGILLPWILVFLLISIYLSRHINLHEMGEDVATSMGANVQRQRFILLLVSTALVGGAVAFAGGIGFVGLMAPHLARRLVGSQYGALIPMAAIIGAALVVIADWVGRSVIAPLEVPAGVFTAAVGAPYFIYLLFKQRGGK
ncbi:FecCD family ABC transporter permease [Mangrovibacillus cuniculi]|uniref:Iron ABC transporter permease n=1 Tax=Mangrovibacillus cuniculi TaxID=2593652 RepID=A0A7S8CCE0_9BACI|nr:iron ABC transporter permease [Mangrovibacillus cuniculi]QPC47417.1 iron ABC transporter permease [Mangrovibacillus cuniculi]